MRARILAVLIVLLMIGWPLTIAGSAGAVTDDSSSLSGSTVEFAYTEEASSQFTNASDDLLVWERSGLPLRADTTASGAKTVMPNHAINFKDNRSGEIEQTSANRDETAVFDKDETIPIKFSSASGANTDAYDGRNAQVIIASFENNEQIGDTGSADELNEVISPALDGNLSEVRTQAEERNVTFEVDDSPKLDSNGDLEYDLEPDAAGPYVVMLALPRGGGGFNTSGGSLTLPGEATLMGVEGVLVQDSASTTSVSGTVAPGEDIDITAGTQLTGSNINHTVVVYNQDTFLKDGQGNDQETNLRLNEDITSSLTSEDIVIEHSIANVNGVGNMSGSATMFGVSASQRTITGTVALADIIDQLSDETNVSVTRETIDPPATTLDASAVVKPSAGQNADLTVQTYNNWSDGTYRIVHMAEDGTVEGLATSTRTIEITGSRDNRRRSSSGGSSDDPKPEVTITERERGVSVSIANIPANTPTQVGTGRNVASGGATVSNFTVDMVRDYDEINLEVDASEQPPDTVPEPANGETLSYVDVDAGDLTDDDYNNVEWEFTVDQERLDELDSSPENVQLNRYNEASGEWESFETTHQGENKFTASVPGFSTFAITAAAIDDGDTDDGTDSTDDGTDSTDDGTDSTDDGTDSTDGDGEDGTDGDGNVRPVGLVILLVVLVIAAAVGVGLYQNQQ